MIRISLLGMPGTGKTTLARRLSKALRIMYISSDALKKTYNLDTDEQVMAKIAECIGDSWNYILDGYPLSSDVSYLAVPLDIVLYLNTSVSKCADRLTLDGWTIQDIVLKLKEYAIKIGCLQQKYIQENKFIRCDASERPSRVFAKSMLKMHKHGVLDATKYINGVLPRD